jgi:hypothetical protein
MTYMLDLWGIGPGDTKVVEQHAGRLLTAIVSDIFVCVGGSFRGMTCV